MAIITTDEFTGKKPVPVTPEAGEIYEVTFKIDTAVTNLASGDFIQLMYVPDDAVLTDIKVGVSATFGSTTIAVGIADALVTTALATTFIAAQTFTTTAVVSANSLILADVPSSTHTADQRIVAVAVAAEGEATNVLYVSVRYRAGRYGK